MQTLCWYCSLQAGSHIKCCGMSREAARNEPVRGALTSTLCSLQCFSWLRRSCCSANESLLTGFYVNYSTIQLCSGVCESLKNLKLCRTLKYNLRCLIINRQTTSSNFYSSITSDYVIGWIIEFSNNNMKWKSNVFFKNVCHQRNPLLLFPPNSETKVLN